jgi:tetratricopeptide (TPR) repeat protein
MPEKKRTVATRAREIAKPMTKPQASKNPKTTDTAVKTGQAPPAQPPGQRQRASFEAAMKLFHARKFKEAKELFEEAVSGPERDVAQRSRLHIAMCERRIGEPAVELGTAEDNYNYGIAMLNARKVTEARTHLEKALEIAPGADHTDHIHYALALTLALAGDLGGAHDHLKRAIELEPKNRLLARQDADFGSIVNQPAFQALIYPEKKNW